MQENEGYGHCIELREIGEIEYIQLTQENTWGGIHDSSWILQI